MVGLALAFALGTVLHRLGVPLSWTLLSLLTLLRPNAPSSGPGLPLPSLALVLVAGSLLASHWSAERAGDCRLHLGEGQVLELRGRLLGRVVEGRGTLMVREGLPGGCNGRIRFVLGRGAEKGDPFSPGDGVVVQGAWRRGVVGREGDPERAGYLQVRSVGKVGVGVGGTRPGVIRDPTLLGPRIQERLGRLFPLQGALVEALILARKEGLAPDRKEAFARAGTAHLLAISGFHVGVVGGLLLLLGGWLGLSHRRRFLLGALGVWSYILVIGLPDAALRAALIITLLSLGRILGRSVSAPGALASAFLLLLAADPGALSRVGFQLSFAGSLGLILWSKPFSEALAPGGGSGWKAALAGGAAAGTAATLATLPLVGWHFGRVSLMGIPMTLLAAPLVTLAIPGVFMALLASFLWFPLGAFLASGVEVDLWLLTRLVEWAADLPFASAWVSRPAILAGSLGLAGGWVAHRTLEDRSPLIRRIVLSAGLLSGLLVGPGVEILLGGGVVEVVALDVGQGDAIGIRSPRGRWILVDAGPRTERFDAGGRVVLPYLRRRGVRRVESLILTHPDMDHVGGAAAVLEGVGVTQILDPGRAVGSEVFVDALEAARARGTPWRVARAGDSLNLDGVALRVLWPPREEAHPLAPSPFSSPREARALARAGNNEASVVVELRYGSFSALLTGDAPVEVEEAVLPLLLSPRIQLLKAGHHGSHTSTSPELVERTRPEAALISVGRRNRYGHPAAGVLRILEGAGVRVFRTDLHGELRVRARKDGSFRVLRLTRQ